MYGSNMIGMRTIKGIRFINKKDSTKFIFVPAAGYADGGSVNNVGSEGNLWFNFLDENRTEYAACLHFNLSYINGGYFYRSYGFPVRAVLTQ